MKQRLSYVILVAGLVGLVLNATSFAEDDGHDHEAAIPHVVLSADQEKLARNLENEFIAPCCWHQPISAHDSQIARTMRAEVRQMIAQGMTAEQIRQHYIAQYGERIMAVPHGGGFNHFAWIIPSVAGAFGVVIAGHLLRTWRRKQSGDEAKTPESGEDAQRFAKVDEQLRKWTD